MVKFTTQTLLLAGLGLFLLAVIGYLIYTRNSSKEGMGDTQPAGGKHPPHQQPGGQPGGQPPAQPQFNPNVPTLVLFHADWCGYCQEFKPLWAQISQFLSDKIQVLDFESKQPITAKLHRGGWPTIKFYPGGIAKPDAAMEYKGDRTNPQNIVTFVASFMAPQQGQGQAPPQPQGQ